jgi:hypothetical protein
MSFHVFVSLLVVCLLFSLARPGRLDWHPLQPSHSRGRAIHSLTQRLLKPRTPLDCPACRLSCAHSSVVGPAPLPVRPWREMKSRRGAPKRVNTEGFACPNHQCPSFGITDAHIHAAFRRWQAWHGFAHPDVSRSCLPYHVHFQAQHCPVPAENPFSADRKGALCVGRRAGRFRCRAGLRLPASDHHHLAVPCWRARADLARAVLPPSLAPAPSTGRTAHQAAQFEAGALAVGSH